MKSMASKAVIASHIDLGVFAEIDMSEAIQFFLEKEKNWIASSPEVFVFENPGFSKTKTSAPRNDELDCLIDGLHFRPSFEAHGTTQER